MPAAELWPPHEERGTVIKHLNPMECMRGQRSQNKGFRGCELPWVKALTPQEEMGQSQRESSGLAICGIKYRAVMTVKAVKLYL